MYEPATINKIPKIPIMLGNSPKIKGDVINNNTGVKASIGTEREISDSLMPLKNNIEATVRITDEIDTAVQKFGPIGGIFSKAKNPNRKGKEKNVHAQATT